MDFSKKTLLITGGTGSFGNAVLTRFLHSDIEKIIIFSRDEEKQDAMRKLYNSEKLSFFIGDIRNIRSIKNALKGVNFVFHSAAFKQVPSCEFHPMEAVMTNIIGTENVLEAAIESGCERVVCLSTDKAVYPINAMGMSKALMEKVIIAKSRSVSANYPVICGTRYGNVMASRGSVIPLIAKQVNSGDPITITDPAMTRFMMTLEDAVGLVLYAFENAHSGDIFVQKSPAVTVATLVEAILDLMGKPDHPIKIIGTRHGEKMFESLLSREEIATSIDHGKYFRIPLDKRTLNYSFFVEKGRNDLTKSSHGEDYNSDNTKRLNLEEMKSLLVEMGFLNLMAQS